MHEIEIARSLINEVLKAVRNPSQVLKVKVEVSELLFIDPKAFESALEFVKRGSALKNAQIEFKIVSGKIQCRNCGFKGRPNIDESIHEIFLLTKAIPCPACGSIAMKDPSIKDFIIKEILLKQ